MALLIHVIQSRVTGQWGYCPAAAAHLLRLELDDKESGFWSPADAVAAARADKSMPPRITIKIIPPQE